MKDRAIGIENEYGIMVSDKNTPIKPLMLVVNLNMAKAPDDAVKAGGRLWFPNGGCLYTDLGHPEYASPEARRIRDVLLYSKAGELLATRAFPTEEYKERKFLLFKNNLGIGEDYRKTGDSFGCHENYMFRNWSVYGETLQTHLISFLATRHIYGGAGWWIESGDFSTSQRATVMERNVGSKTTSGRAIINTKEEFHASGGTKRLHLIMGDANILDFAFFVKIGATSLLLSMLEDLDHLTLKPRNAVRAMQLSAFGPGPHARVMEFEDGSMMSALDVQKMYLERVQNYLDSTTFPSVEAEEESRLIAKYWEQALIAIDNNDTEWMLGRFDYATKQYLAEKLITKQGLTSEEDKFKVRKDVDILYHGISDRRFRERVEKKWASRRLVTDEEVENATNEPPSDTRARLRGNAAKMISTELNNNGSVGWDYVKIRDKHFNLRKPLSYRHSALVSYMMSLEDE